MAGILLPRATMKFFLEVGDMTEQRIADFIPALVDSDEGVRRYGRRLLAIDDEARVAPFLTESLSSANDRVRWSAAVALGRLGDPVASDVLVEALDDGDETARQGAAAALANLGDVRALPVLAAGLSDGDKTIRRRSAEMLGVLGDSGAVQHLLAALKDPAIRVRLAATRSVRKLDMAEHRAEAVVALMEVLERKSYDSTHHRLREETAQALGQLGDSRAIPTLVAALEYRYDSDLHSCAAEALGEIGDPRAVPGLIVALTDGHARVKGDAAQALGRIGDSRAVGPLISTLHWTRGRDVPRTADVTAEALGRLGDAQAIPHLLARLQDGGLRTRSVAQALRQLGDTLAVPVMIEQLESSDSSHARRSRAAAALGHLGDPAAVSPLIGSLKDDHSSVRPSAADALGAPR